MAFPHLLEHSQPLRTALRSSAIRLLDAGKPNPAPCPPLSQSLLSCKGKPAPELPTLQVSCWVSGISSIPAWYTVPARLSESRKLHPHLEPAFKSLPLKLLLVGKPGAWEAWKAPCLQPAKVCCWSQQDPSVILMPTPSGHQQLSDWPHIQDSLTLPPASRVSKIAKVCI